MSILDAARGVRSGEELDAEKLGAYLSQALGVKLAKPLSVKQFPSGHSNLTYSVELELEDGDTRDLVVRRPPFGNRVKTAHDMGREFRVLRALEGRYDKAPRALLSCEDESILGAPFYVMNRLRGVILRRKPIEGITLDEATLGRLGMSVVSALAELHELRVEGELATLGKPEGYVERQVTGWTKRYADAKTDDIPEIDRMAQWLADNLPVSPRASMIHGDFKYDNLVLDPESVRAEGRPPIIGVLDWEMSTLGDPLMDLGTTLAYWVEATDPDPLKTYTFGPTHLPGSPTRRQLLDAYARLRPGIVPDDMRFYYVFALFKNAVVAQQIYARYHRGVTKDERFGQMIFGVRILGAAGVNAIDTGTI